MNPLPELFLERLAAGEVLEDPRAGTPDVPTRVADLHRSDRDLLATFPPSRWVPRIIEGVRSRSHPPRVGWSVLGTVIVAALALLIVAMPRASDPDVRTKGPGAPSLQVMRKLGASAEPLDDGARVVAGDVVQLSYRIPVRQHGVILSFDGAGQVTVHLPASGMTAPAIGPGEGRVDHAYQLDAAPAFERFVLLTSSEPFAVDDAVAAARATATARNGASKTLSLDPKITQQSVTLMKVSP